MPKVGENCPSALPAGRRAELSEPFSPNPEAAGQVTDWLISTARLRLSGRPRRLPRCRGSPQSGEPGRLVPPTTESKEEAVPEAVEKGRPHKA